MNQKFYELEVERTRNLGNMTSALLMLASSMDTLTRFVSTTSPLAFGFSLKALSQFNVSPHLVNILHPHKVV